MRDISNNLTSLHISVFNRNLFKTLPAFVLNSSHLCTILHKLIHLKLWLYETATPILCLVLRRVYVKFGVVIYGLVTLHLVLPDLFF